MSFEGAAQVVATLAVTPLAADIDQLSAGDQQRLVAAVARQTRDGAINAQLEANVAIARQ